jgi:hypothetical protein
MESILFRSISSLHVLRLSSESFAALEYNQHEMKISYVEGHQVLKSMVFAFIYYALEIQMDEYELTFWTSKNGVTGKSAIHV